MDFFAVILHELGHCLQLDHVNDNKDVMYWSRTIGGWPCDKRTITLNSHNQKAGDIMMARSTVIDVPSNCDDIYRIAFYADTSCRVEPMAIQANETKYEIFIYPNPFNNKIVITSEGDQMLSQVNIFNIYGQKIAEYKLNGKQADLETSNLVSGIYLLEVYNDTGLKITKRIICTN
jgi:hypothetical protein